MLKDAAPPLNGHTREQQQHHQHSHQQQSDAALLAQHSGRESGLEGDGVVIPSRARENAPKLAVRHPSLVKIEKDGVRSPRTANRVRFDLDSNGSVDHVPMTRNSVNGLQPSLLGKGEAGDTEEDEERSSLNTHDDDEEEEDTADGEGMGQQAPLLTGLQAPSVMVANEWELHVEDLLEHARPKSGLASAFLNMANSIIGAGIIGQPYAFRQAGLLAGILLLVCLTVTVDWTIRLIVINSKLSGSNSFQGTMEHTFGKPGLVAISIAQWAFAFGGMIAFCIIVGDTIPRVIQALFPSLSDTHFLWLLTNRRAIIVVFILGISLPLSLYRDIAKLAKASGLALLSMLIIVLAILTQGPRMSPDARGSLKGSLFVNKGISQAIGVISFAFVCHHNSLLIYGSLKTPTLDRFSLVTHYSTFISMLACMIVALAGFLTFGDKTLGNVLNNFPTDNVMINIARLCFGLNMLSTLPLECFVCREVMVNYWFPNQPFSMRIHLVFTVSLVVFAMTISLITCDLGAVFELVGATSACALAYIFPPICYLKLSQRSWRTIPAILCAAFGMLVMLVSLYQALVNIIGSKRETQKCD